jgi:hypothetical protein
MPDLGRGRTEAPDVEVGLRDLNGSNENRISTSRRASFSNFGRSAAV